MRTALLGLVLAVLWLSACAEQPLLGIWSGRDESGRMVVYEFSPDGTGARRADDGEREPFTYEITTGYPNLIEVAFPTEMGLGVQKGLVEITSDRVIRIDLAPAGHPAPARLSAAAITLRKPGTR